MGGATAWVWGAVAIAAMLVACATHRGAPAPDDGAPAIGSDTPSALPGVENVLLFAPGVYSGSVPHGEEGFESLERLGVRTVVSVDGAEPAIDEAEALGMRYVHLPIQYSGIGWNDQRAIAKALSEMPRPIYVHCHHGKHRGPAAAAYGLVAAGEISPKRGVSLMRAAGTSESYPGLYSCVRRAEPVDPAALEDEEIALPEVAEVSGLVESMAAIGRAWEHLKLLRDAGWSAPRDHPDLVAVAEARILHDRYADLVDDPDVRNFPAEFHEMLGEAARRAERLVEAVQRRSVSPREADRWMEASAQSCRRCHDAYRNE